MATPHEKLLEYFTAMDAAGAVIVKDTPKLDLETYMQNYNGRTRYDRLMLIGQCSVVLCVDALKVAVAEAKRGKDVARYREAVDLLRQASPNEPEASLDRKWIDVTEKSNREETKRLEQELKGYKNNLVRESIRMGNEDLGKHLEEIGNLADAAEAYSRMRPDVSTSKQVADVGKHIIRVALQKRDWTAVNSSLNRIAGLQSQLSEDLGFPTYIRVMDGLANLGQERYKEAAAAFLKADHSAPASSYADAMSPNDVAIYGSLLSLATMDRVAIQTNVLENSSFRSFLELEPHLRRAITQFVNGRYSSCLEILESYRSDYLLDMHLQRHIPELFLQIRSKCISQYLLPFSCVTIASLDESFAIDGESIEEELVTMISNGILDARINSVDKLVTATAVKPRIQMQLAALKAAQQYETEAAERLRRMNILAAELEVKSNNKRGMTAADTEWEGSSSAMASVF
ncbi:hypothetical protein MCOR27_003708 [Pyricularia oryzae]|uniref:PCI domain-containing protein n=3 Tax=Pyricularia TaxID=48558 RepID=A0ABQ8NAM4_PYRGI|nr:CSN-1 [Pyricularia oryzae 70-15]KAH8845193.1 hypothetical protein MCOR01_002440 [Pyricularia oryzae]KAI6293598.1 hypothetical protein MCOR33_009012 [Pyricularia grisea]EHA57969.1 CSN-1 [Pyricularia oryzae 70-15]KAH9428955.1 hypothetical protein MCOR02_010374 [Pyricularia oryzae]KAI6259122.1 hypothetical protein MCOR19_004519 [Pyricularia oryzae]